MPMPSPRQVNYDNIARLYDAQPYRDKNPDPALLAAHQNHPVRTILDMCCGTGNQLIANHVHLPDAVMVGLDFSHGMLRQVRAKAPDIAWVHADSTVPPFAGNCFDYISHQFAFHHIADKATASRVDPQRPRWRGHVNAVHSNGLCNILQDLLTEIDKRQAQL